MPAPETFYFPPKQLPWMDSLFSIFGRALVLATRVESGMYAVAGPINLRLQPGVMDSEEALGIPGCRNPAGACSRVETLADESVDGEWPGAANSEGCEAG